MTINKDLGGALTMARLMPEVNIEEITHQPEKEVARALVDGLPSDCLVFHSYPWLAENDNRGKKRLYQGEIDFLVLHPKLGAVLVVEVKGGEVFYDSKTAKWDRRNAQHRVKDPFAQASRGMRHIKGLIERYSSGNFVNRPFSHGYAVVFPNCEYSGPMPPGAHPSVLFCLKDLPILGKKVESLIRKWSAKDMKSFSREEMAQIKRAILPEFNLFEVLSKRIENEEEILIKLTEQQAYILRMLAEWPKALIKGVAGSGKTLLALAQANRFAAEGKKVLFTCYNKKLAKWLSEQIPNEFKNQIVVRSFHSLAINLCKQAKIDYVIPKEKDKQALFWSDEAPNLFIEAASVVDANFDAIVVDEGQDFNPNWWDALQCLNDGGKNGRFYVFYDSAQSIYAEKDFKPPFDIESLALPYNCRNTKNIANYAGKIIDKEIEVLPKTPDGLPCEEFKVKSAEEALSKLEEIVAKWLKKGLRPSQIAILSQHKKASTLLRGKQKLGDFFISDDVEKWKSDEVVMFETIRSFKGLEADAIVLYAVPETNEESHFTRADYYIAASRAKHILKVIKLVLCQH